MLLTATMILLFAYRKHKKAAQVFKSELEKSVQASNELKQEFEEYKSQFQGIVDKKEEENKIQLKINQLTISKNTLEEEEKTLQSRIHLYEEKEDLYLVGHYTPRYDFPESTHYKAKLDQILEQQKSMHSLKLAAICDTSWTVGGSVAEGKKQMDQYLKLMLRAFNGESDVAIAKVKFNNAESMEKKIRKSFDSINLLGKSRDCKISPEYLELKIQELALCNEYELKLQEEKDEQRRIREQMREEEKALREIEQAKIEAEKEEKRYAEALEKATKELTQASGAKQEALQRQLEELHQKLAEAQQQKIRATSQAQLTRSGHIYIISNIGSFGEDVFKIGMTRRLEPMDRIKELGDASVPFQFDVHAIIYSEDAPALETKLHKQFHNLRVNKVNEHREFFNVSIQDIIKTLQEHGIEHDVIIKPDAAEYRASQAYEVKIVQA